MAPQQIGAAENERVASWRVDEACRAAALHSSRIFSPDVTVLRAERRPTVGDGLQAVPRGPV